MYLRFLEKSVKVKILESKKFYNKTKLFPVSSCKPIYFYFYSKSLLAFEEIVERNLSLRALRMFRDRKGRNFAT